MALTIKTSRQGIFRYGKTGRIQPVEYPQGNAGIELVARNSEQLVHLELNRIICILYSFIMSFKRLVATK